ncbi:hypothetical protein M427DRAFT_59443 [Gonapodya prolifera JEL478]|uniref:GPN-loop GTPase 2 n=1 Tax=Gonapodya prolifera (strain JEL478) TaxID=1344416 RepID=A0A139A6R0_GONPJ|nr:hypothetical protein M427DRAFT_59443 [Gonapodya prolifera JEL478]|eukprot:KXS12502.1 hypothetical protein M427DRAFT_59443 [Gonapodya prolifera JEL478]
MAHFLGLAGRDVAVVNLDPANENIPYTPALSIFDLIALEDAMEAVQLGPNGGMLYCLDYLEKNLDWFVDELSKSTIKDKYLILDLPGQVELVTNHTAVPKVLEVLEKRLGYRLTVVNLIPSHLILHPNLYLSALILSLQTMLHLSYPFISILSKIDTLSPSVSLVLDRNSDACNSLNAPSNPLPARLSTYLSATSLETLLTSPISDDPFLARYNDLTESLVSLVEDFGLVGFLPLAVEDLRLVLRVAKDVDHASGYYPSSDKELDLSEVRVPRKWAGGAGLEADPESAAQFNVEDLTDADYFDDLNMEEFFDTIEEEYLGERDETEFVSGDDFDDDGRAEGEDEHTGPIERFDGRESRRPGSGATLGNPRSQKPPEDVRMDTPDILEREVPHMERVLDSGSISLGSPNPDSSSSGVAQEGHKRAVIGTPIAAGRGRPVKVSEVDAQMDYDDDYWNDPRLRRAIP